MECFLTIRQLCWWGVFGPGKQDLLWSTFADGRAVPEINRSK
jgi:hypothetical protein